MMGDAADDAYRRAELELEEPDWAQIEMMEDRADDLRKRLEESGPVSAEEFDDLTKDAT